MRLLILLIIKAALLYESCANPVAQTGPVLEAEGWTPVRSSQVN